MTGLRYAPTTSSTARARAGASPLARSRTSETRVSGKRLTVTARYRVPKCRVAARGKGYVAFLNYFVALHPAINTLHPPIPPAGSFAEAIRSVPCPRRRPIPIARDASSVFLEIRDHRGGLCFGISWHVGLPGVRNTLGAGPTTHYEAGQPAAAMIFQGLCSRQCLFHFDVSATVPGHRHAVGPVNIDAFVRQEHVWRS
jgi:hypothetical protein